MQRIPHTEQQLFLSQLKNEDGFSLVEVLVALILSSIVALGIMQSTLTSYRFSQRMVNDSLAGQLALEKMEEISSISPQTLDDTDDAVEDPVVRNNISFIRTVDVSINADRSRTVAVRVQSKNSHIAIDTTLTNSFALWGER